MIARHEATQDKSDIWTRLAATLPQGSTSWRQDGKPMQRDGKHFARFVGYVEANTVRERLDSVVPGEWDLTLELLPPLVLERPNPDAAVAFKARLQVLGVIREDIGHGKDYKQASTDAFKRAAVRFGIAHELYDLEQNWVQVDGDGKYAKPLEDPQVAYDRRYGKGGNGARNTPVSPPVQPAAKDRTAEILTTPPEPPAGQPYVSAHEDPLETPGAKEQTGDDPKCPKCSGRTWDNRATKRNAKAPDFKCRDRSCDGVIWPPKGGSTPAPKPAPVLAPTGPSEEWEDVSDADDIDDIPFN